LCYCREIMQNQEIVRRIKRRYIPVNDIHNTAAIASTVRGKTGTVEYK
jgi:hypothetical protein